MLMTIANLALHAGHGRTGDGFSLVHHLTEPVHVLSGVALALVVAIVVGFLRRRGRLGAA
jgi:hypothetical protein